MCVCVCIMCGISVCVCVLCVVCLSVWCVLCVVCLCVCVCIMCGMSECGVCVYVCIPHLLYPFICWWNLGCLRILAITNNAAMNIVGCMYLFKLVFWVFFFFFGYIPRSGIAGSYGSSIFSSLRNLHTVSTVAAPIYIPTNNVQGFPFLHILANICYLCSFWWYPFWWMWGDTSSWSWFSFPWWLDVEHLFMCLLDICISSLEKCLFSSSAHF